MPLTIASLRGVHAVRRLSFFNEGALTTILPAFLVLGLFVLTGGCESRPELVPAPTSGFGPSNRDKVIVFIHGVTASNEKSWRNPITGAYWPELMQADPELKDYGTYLLGYYSPKSTIAEIANGELQRLKDEGLLAPNKQVELVAQSMGGLVAKEILTPLNRPNREERERLDRVKGAIRRVPHTIQNIVSTATAFEALEYLNRTKEEGIGVLTPAGGLVGIASLQAIQSGCGPNQGSITRDERVP